MSNPKIKGGWQCWVDIYDNHVIKTFKTKDEMRTAIENWLVPQGRGGEVEEKIKLMVDDINTSTRIVKERKPSPELIAFTEFLPDGTIKQKKAVVLQEAVETLQTQGKNKDIEMLIDETINLIFNLWQYGVHEKTFKIGINTGIVDGKVTLLDIFELTDDLAAVQQQIQTISWDKPERYAIPHDVVNYAIKQLKTHVTFDNLSKYWGTMLQN